MATVDLMGATREASLLLLPEPAAVGDFVLIHAGFAIQKLEPAEGRETIRLLAEIARCKEPGEKE